MGHGSTRRTLAAALLVAVVGTAAEPAPGDGGKPAPPRPAAGADKAPAPPARKLDLSRLPADAVYVLTEQLETLRKNEAFPGFLLVSFEKWQELQDKIDRLMAQAKPERPVPPSECQVRGKVE